MTNQERIQSHNTRLAAMKETVAGLPDAGGGGSSVELRTVSIVNNSNTHIWLCITRYVNGVVTGRSDTNDYDEVLLPPDSNITFNDVVYGTNIMIVSAYDNIIVTCSISSTNIVTTGTAGYYACNHSADAVNTITVSQG